MQMAEFVTVEVSQGSLRGKRVTSSTSGATYCSFQGIPYAKPPLGPLRFKPPEEAESWTGTRDALQEGACAPQINIFTKTISGTEDCLFLNVYTPQWPARTPKAVMVWIHGGAFILGSGNSDIYGPDFLVAEDVVLVTFNYRIGALGFLYLEGCDVTGNNGLRDQVMALKWVRDNIAQFGGDPGNVTIFGESAGGISVHLLMLSPLARGLFHRAIAQSGTALLSGCHTPSDVSNRRAVRLAKLLGCPSEDQQTVADYLRTVPAEKIVAQQSECLLEEEKARVIPLACVPSEEVGPEAFLPAPVRTLLDEGQFAKVPFITGVTSAEGKLMLMDMFGRVTLSEIDQNFEKVLPPEWFQTIGSEKCRHIAGVMKKYYFGENQVGDETISHYVDMMSDLMFVFPMHQTVRAHVAWSAQPTYVYLFDHVNESRFNFLTKTVDELPGAPHGSEIVYFFKSSLNPHSFSPGSPDAVVKDTCVKLWTQFAKSGNPSNGTANVKWIPTTEGSPSYLKIKEDFVLETDLYKQRMDFLDDLYKKVLSQAEK